MDRKVVEAHAKNGDMGSDWMTDHSAGSGPFVLVKWEREAEIVMKANPYYWKPGQPVVKEVIIKHVPEPTDQLLLIKKGDVAAPLKSRYLLPSTVQTSALNPLSTTIGKVGGALEDPRVEIIQHKT